MTRSLCSTRRGIIPVFFRFMKASIAKILEVRYTFQKDLTIMQAPLFPEEEGGTDIPPEIIDVLGKKFKVKLLAPDEKEDCDGYMDLTEQVIAIRLQPANDYNHDTGFHEVVHAVDEILGLGLREKQVHQLAAGLIAVLKQNPDFVKWLLS